MPRKKIQSNKSLGNQLIKTQRIKKFPNQQQARKDDEPVGGYKVHAIGDLDVKKPLVSVLEQNSLEEFVQLAQLSSKNFEAESASQVVFSDSHIVQGGADNLANSAAMVNVFLGERGEQQISAHQYVPLTIPRRPKWNRGMTSHEIESQENMSFLEWRRDIACMEQNNITLAITPFEKNVDIWRQLWRVIEKSDLLLQIVDSRNPYFFYSADLEKYIGEVGVQKGQREKQFILLINKADYLSEELIQHWNEYFTEKGIQHIFFSALDEQAKIDHEDLEEVSEDSNEDDLSDGWEEENVEEIKREVEETQGGFKNELERLARDEEEAQKNKVNLDETLEEELVLGTTSVFTRAQLLTWLKRKARAMQKDLGTEDRLNVGTIGYPNVGKSSVINVLMGVKKVTVGALPGKTKHFQTLDLGREIMLCDCPGLVFPSFANSKAEMMCCGVLPIDQMRDHISPISLVLSRIPKEVLEAQYKVYLPPMESSKYTTATFLQVYASKRGWRTGGNTPAEMHAAKIVMKDYTTGKLIFCMIRPDFNPALHAPCQQSGFNIKEAIQSWRDQPSAQNYEEIKVNLSVTPADVQSEATTNLGEESKIDSPVKAVGHAVYEESENDFDAQFFGRKVPKIKLNKGEKRQLKFEMKAGANINEVGDLKTYLNSKMKQGKETHNTARGAKYGPKDLQNPRGTVSQKTNTYKGLEGYTSD